MKEIFESILSATLSGSVIILVILAIRLVLAKAPRRYVCLLWLLAAVRLLIPFEIESSLSLQPDPEQIAALQSGSSTVQENVSPVPAIPDDAVSGSEPDGADIVISTGEALQGGTVTGDSVLVPNPTYDADVSDPVDSVTVHETDWLSVASYVWVAGACGIGIYTLASYILLRRRVADAVQVDEGIFEHPGIDSPFLLGYLKPRIYLPTAIPMQDLTHILAHERTHIRRFDNWTKLLGFLCLAVHWFNPLVWLAYSLLCKDIEMACDEEVVKTMDVEDRKAYSAALLSCAAGKRNFSACPVAFGEVSVKARILKVLNYRKPAFWLSIIAIAAVIFVAVCFMTSPVRTDPMEACRTALTQLQATDSYALYMTNQGDAEYMSDRTTFVILNRGEDRYILTAYADWTTEELRFDGKMLARDTTLAVPEEEIRSEWVEYDDSGDNELSGEIWLLELEWDETQITLRKDSVKGGVRTVELTVTDEKYPAGYCTLDFSFDARSGELISAARRIPSKDSSAVKLLSTVYPVSADSEAIAEVIETCYVDAVGQKPSHGYTEEQLSQALEALSDEGYPSMIYAQDSGNINYEYQERIYIKYCFAYGDPEADLALLRFWLEYGSAVYVDPAPIQEMYITESEDWLSTCVGILQETANADSYYVELTDASKTWAFPNLSCIRSGDNWLIESYENETLVSWLNYDDSGFCREQQYSGSTVIGDSGWLACELESAPDALPWILTHNWAATDAVLESVTASMWGVDVEIRVPSQNVTLDFHFNNGEFSYIYEEGNGAYIYYSLHSFGDSTLEACYSQAMGRENRADAQSKEKCRLALEKLMNTECFNLVQSTGKGSLVLSTQYFWKEGADWLLVCDESTDSCYLEVDGNRYLRGTASHPDWAEADPAGDPEFQTFWLTDFVLDDENTVLQSKSDEIVLTVTDDSYADGYYELIFTFDEETGHLLNLVKRYREDSDWVILNVQVQYNEPGSCAAYIDSYYQEAVNSISPAGTIPTVSGISLNHSDNGFFWNADGSTAASIHNGVLKAAEVHTAEFEISYGDDPAPVLVSFNWCADGGEIGVYSGGNPKVEAIPGNDAYVMVTLREFESSVRIQQVYLVELETMAVTTPLAGVDTAILDDLVNDVVFSSDLRHALLDTSDDLYLLDTASGAVTSVSALTGISDVYDADFVSNELLSVVTLTDAEMPQAWYADCTVYNLTDGSTRVLFADARYGWLIDAGGMDSFGSTYVHNHGTGGNVCIVDCLTGIHSSTDIECCQLIGRCGAENLWIMPYASDTIYLVQPDGTTTALFTLR